MTFKITELRGIGLQLVNDIFRNFGAFFVRRFFCAPGLRDRSDRRSSR